MASGAGIFGGVNVLHNWRRGVASAVFAAISVATLGCAGGGANIAGGWIVTLDDGDLSPAAFADVDAAAPFSSGPDTLTMLRLPLPRQDDGAAEFAQAEIENRALGATPGMAVSRDGRWALVASTPGPDEVGATATLIELGAGSPRVTEELELEGGSRIAASFHPFEQTGAVLTADPPVLTLLDLQAGGVARRHALPLTGMIDPADDPTGLVWHPSGRFLAVTLGVADRVAFLRLERGEDGGVELAKWGDDVGTDAAPSGGVFSPDGRFFISMNLGFRDQPDVEVVAASGTMSVIRVSDSISEDVAHERIGSARLPHQPHAFAMSPDGDLIVTASRREADLALEERGERLGGTLVATRFDPASGVARPGPLVETSSLPSAVCFDETGDHVLMTDFNASEVQVWKAQGAFGLRYTGLNVGTGFGPHAIAVTPTQ